MHDQRTILRDSPSTLATVAKGAGRDMPLDGMRRNVQLVSHLPVGQIRAECRQHLALARRDLSRVHKMSIAHVVLTPW